MCDPYTPAQSKHTFCMSTFFRKKRLQTTAKRGDPPPTPPENNVCSFFLQKVTKKSPQKNTSKCEVKFPQQCSFLEGGTCDPYTPAQSKHTFAISIFLRKTRKLTSKNSPKCVHFATFSHWSWKLWRELIHVFRICAMFFRICAKKGEKCSKCTLKANKKVPQKCNNSEMIFS